MAALADGGDLVVWQSYWGETEGTPSVSGIQGPALRRRRRRGRDGGLKAVWASWTQDGSGFGVFGRIYLVPPEIRGTTGDDATASQTKRLSLVIYEHINPKR